MTNHHRVRIAFLASTLIVAVLLGSVAILATTTGSANAPYLAIEGVPFEDAKSLGYTFREPAKDFQPRTSAETARLAANGQFGGAKVERVVLADVSDSQSVDRPMWVVVLDPSTVIMPDLSQTGESSNLKLEYAIMLFDPETGAFVSSLMH